MWQHIKSICRWKQVESAIPAGTGGEQHEREAENAPGDFYVEKDRCCICCLAESEAPDLMGFYEDGSGSHANSHCYFRKQPSTPDEVEQAIMAVWVSEVAALRYGGHDAYILSRLKQLGCEEQCDHPMSEGKDAAV